MKKIILASLLAICNILQANVVIPPTPIGKWEFNGNAFDGIGSNHGIVFGATLTHDRCGNANSAYHFNGIWNYIQMPQAGPQGNSPRSVSFWMRTNYTNPSYPNSLSAQTPFCYGSSTGNGDSFCITHEYCGPGIGLDLSNQFFNTGGPCLSDGNWHHVVAIYGGGQPYSTAIFYIDGVLQSIGCNVVGLTAALNTLGGNNFPIVIGGSLNQDRYFNGDLDDFYLYNRALTFLEVQDLFNYTCGITPLAPCFCRGSNGVSQNIYTAPVIPGATYLWTFPANFNAVSPTTNPLVLSMVTPPTNPVTINCWITTSCGGSFLQTYTFNYCENLNNNGSVILNPIANAAYCANDPHPSPVVLNAQAIFPLNNVTYQWFPGGHSNPLVIHPTVSTSYMVIATSPGYCPAVANVLVNVQNNCCPPLVNLIPLTGPTIPPGNYSGGTYVITNNITLTGSANFIGSQFLFATNAKVIVPSGMNLDIDGSHLYACGLNMWDGIEIQNGGSISSNPNLTGSTGVSSLIEDAKIAIDLGNITLAHAALPINIENLTFNKNHTGIKIHNSSPVITHLPLLVKGCVFTSRQLPFTTTTWPSAFLNDLRFVPAGAFNGLSSPLPVGNYAYAANLKQPYTSHGALYGIQIDDIGQTNNGTMPSAGIDIGTTFQGGIGDFNLFDKLGIGIDITDASFTSMNNVFQDMVYSNTTPVMEGIGIKHNVQGLMNARLDLMSATAGLGNRFWNCYEGVKATKVLEVRIKNGLFRSSQFYIPGIPPVFAPGNAGISLITNRYDYIIHLNEFNNVNTGIVFSNFISPFNTNGTNVNGIYASDLSIQQNYFGAHVNSGNALVGEYMSDAIRITGMNGPFYTLAAATSMGSIISNKINRAFRGIYLEGMNNYPIDIANNLIHIVDENLPPNTSKQFGIEAFDNQGNLDIIDNTISSTGTTNQDMSLIYCKNNLGIGSPSVSCNMLSNSYAAFEFEGNNLNTKWLGNSMNTHNMGLLLSFGGVIGTQGSGITPLGCGNIWTGCTWDTWVDATSNANLSILNCETTPASFLPMSNGGPGVNYINPSTNLVWVSCCSYQCPTAVYPTVPTQKSAPVTTGVNAQDVKDLLNVEIYPNPTSGMLTIIGTGKNQNLTCIVRDVTGKMVLTKEVVTDNQKATLMLELQPGVYFMEIKNDKGSIGRKRLIIE